MAFTNPPHTWQLGDEVTALLMNTEIRDQFLELWKGTTAGDLAYWTSGTTRSRLPIGATKGMVLAVNSAKTAPEWKIDYKTVVVPVVGDTVDLSLSSSKSFTVPSILNGMNLVEVAAVVYTTSISGSPTFTLTRTRSATANLMLSTDITIDENELTSYTAATPAVINTSYDDVVTGDQIKVNCTVIGSGTKGLEIHLKFALP